MSKKQVAKAVSPEDLHYLKDTAPHVKRLSQMTPQQANTHMTRKKKGGFVARQGGKNTGESVFHVDRRAAGEPKKILTAHEEAHASPKRSEYRLHHQIANNPYKMGREEARADYLASGHYSENGGVRGHAPRARLDQETEQKMQSKLGYMKPKPETKFHQGYFGTMDLLRDKGVKSRVTKSYTSTQMSILRRAGMDPISKGFASLVENAAVATGTGVGVHETRKKRKRRKKVEKSLTPEEVQREVTVRQNTKGHRFNNKLRHKLGLRPVQKSLVNGKWLKSSEALSAYKKGQKVGGYTGGKTPGMTPAHAEIKEQTAQGADWMKKVQRNPQESHSTLGMLGLHGLAVRTGGKSSGKSTVLINPQAIARNSKGKRDYRKNKKMVLTHENAHAQAKRSQYRSHQLNASDKKMGGEEGRADYLSQGHHSGYKTPLERSYLDNAPNKEFGAAYKDVQDRMQRAGTKVRKSMEFPMKGEVGKAFLPNVGRHQEAMRKVNVAGRKIARAKDKVHVKAYLAGQKADQKSYLATRKAATKEFLATPQSQRAPGAAQKLHDSQKAGAQANFQAQKAKRAAFSDRPSAKFGGRTMSHGWDTDAGGLGPRENWGPRKGWG